MAAVASPLQIWTIATSTDEIDEVRHDPGQVVYTRVIGRDPRPDFLGDDGSVAEHRVNGLEVKLSPGHGEGFVDHVAVPGESARLYVTDRRLIVLLPDVDLGRSRFAEAADWVIPGVEGLRMLGRGARRMFGERRHLVAQIDYQSLVIVRYFQARGFGQASLLQFSAHVGDPWPGGVMGLWTSMPRRHDVGAVGADVLERARRAQLRRCVAPMDEAGRHRTRTVAFEPSGLEQDAMLAGLPGAVRLTDYHELMTAPHAGRGGGPTPVPVTAEITKDERPVRPGREGTAMSTRTPPYGTPLGGTGPPPYGTPPGHRDTPVAPSVERAKLRVEFDHGGRTYSVESSSLQMWNVHMIAKLNTSMTLETDLRTGERVFVTWSQVGVIRLMSVVDEKGFAVG